MKKIILLIVACLCFGSVSHAGFSVGMTGAVKKQVDKLDKKVKQKADADAAAALVAASTNVMVASGMYQYETLDGRRTMARASNGHLYLAYRKMYSGNYRLFLARSTDNGHTWADTTATPVDNSGCPVAGSPALAIDSHAVLWLAYGSNTAGSGCSNGMVGVSSAAAPGTTWSPWISIPGAHPYVGYQGRTDIAVAGDNSVHMVWASQDAFAPGGYAYGWVVKYSSCPAAGSTWGTYVTLPGSTGDSTAGLQNPSLAIDGNNVLHVAAKHCGPTCGPDNGPGRIVYSSKSVTGASWTGPVTVIDLTSTGRNQDAPSLAIDPDNKLHLVWHGQDDTNTANYQIKYSYLTPGAAAWSAWINLQSILQAPQEHPFIAADSSGDLYVVWSGTDTVSAVRNVKYSRYSGGAWSSWTNLTSSAYDQAFPVLRWAGWYNNGGYLNMEWTKYNGSAYELWFKNDTSKTFPNGYSNSSYAGNWTAAHSITSYTGSCGPVGPQPPDQIFVDPVTGSITWDILVATMNLSNGTFSGTITNPSGCGSGTLSGSCSSYSYCTGTYNQSTPGAFGTEAGTLTWTR